MVGQGSVFKRQGEGNLDKESVGECNFGRGIWGWGALRTEKRYKRQGQGSPPLGGNETETDKESLPANPIFNFQEFG